MAKNYPGTTLRNVRVDDELWLAAKAKAQSENTDLSTVVRDALRRYVEAGDRKNPEEQQSK